MFPPQKASQTEAAKFCAKQGMQICSIDTVAEQKQVDEYLGYIGLSSEVVFSSLNLASITKTPVWGKGKSPLGAGKCHVLYKKAFYNSSCAQKSHFACEESDKPTKKPSILDLLPIDDAILNFIGGKNYLVPSEKANYPQAQDLCTRQGMELMSLESLAETSLVQDLLGDLGVSATSMMTSLKKMSGGSYSWLSGAAASVLKWAPNQPVASGGECAALDSLGLKGVSCDSVSNFVCESPGPNSFQAVTTTEKNAILKLLPLADAVPVKIGNGEYLLPSEKADQAGASKLCGTKGMSLMSLDSLAETDLIQDYLNSVGMTASSVLTSLKRVSGGDWLSSFSSASLPWLPEPPGGTKGKDCAGLSVLGLSPISCDDLSNFVCEAPTNSKPELSTTLNYADYDAVTESLSLHMVQFQDKTLTFMNQQANQDQAEKACSDINESLVTIESFEEHLAILREMALNGLSDKTFLTSLKRKIVETPDGEVLEVFSWLFNRPLVPPHVGWTAEPTGDNACGAYQGGTFVTVDCLGSHNFICEFPPPDSQPQPAEPEPLPPPAAPYPYPPAAAPDPQPPAPAPEPRPPQTADTLLTEQAATPPLELQQSITTPSADTTLDIATNDTLYMTDTELVTNVVTDVTAGFSGDLTAADTTTTRH
ncbi:C-type mannose receptor 2-like [Cloeon dipterum]|uniref:C-type mannose receptor 2-like n=1 Tax=Cloeon dipterum TaxID=197152 RepID=UPI0032209FF1